MPRRATLRRPRQSRHSGCAPGCSSRCSRSTTTCGGAIRRSTTFERVLVRELQRDADDDRGAARLLKQTTVSRRGLSGIRGAAGRDGGRRRIRAADDAARGRACAATATGRRHRRRALGRLGRSLAGGSRAAHAAAAARTDRHRRHARDDRCGSAGSSREVHARVRRRRAAGRPRRRGRSSRLGLCSIAPSETQPFTVSRDREDELSSIAAARKDDRSIRSRSPGGGVQAPAAVRVSRPRRVRRCRHSVSDLRRAAAGGRAVRGCARSGVRVRHIELHARAGCRAAGVAALLVRSRRSRDTAIGRRGTESRAQRRRVFRRRREPSGVRALEGGAGGGRRGRGAARAGRKRTPVGAARCAARVSRQARSHSRDRRSAARAAPARAPCGALRDSRTAEGPPAPGRFAGRAVERRRHDSAMDRRADVRAARRSCRRAAARRASRALRRIRRGVSRRPRRRGVAAALVEEHLLSGVAVEPARLARFARRRWPASARHFRI